MTLQSTRTTGPIFLKNDLDFSNLIDRDHAIDQLEHREIGEDVLRSRRRISRPPHTLQLYTPR